MATITNCNKLITLGTLDSFINGLIQDDNGNTLSVNYGGKSAEYCPTYSELTGGSFIQVSSQNASPTLDKDGIVINGSYQSNQCVIQGDLEVKYTRFESLTVTANPTTVGACSAVATLGYTLNYNRYTKSYTNECTNTTTSVISTQDTIANVSWLQSPTIGTITYPTFNINKNEGGTSGTSNSRTSSINAKVVFRGTNNQSNTIVITQNGLDGHWDTYSSTSEDEYSNFILTSYIIPFTGGTATGAINKKTTTYANQRWVDDCGTVYPSKTQTVIESTASTQENWSSGITAGDCNDSTWVSGDTYNRHYKPTLHGVEADREISQTGICCSCNDFEITSSLTAFTADGGNQSVYYSAGTCVSITSVTSDAGWITPTLEANNSRIKITVSENTGASRTENVRVIWAGPNNCSSSTTISVTQSGATCDASTLILSTTALTFEATETTSQSITVTSGYCHQNLAISIDTGSDYFSASMANGTIVVTPKSQNPLTVDRTGTIRLSYYVGTQEFKFINLVQSARACACSDLSVTGSPVAFSATPGTQEVGYTADTCITSVSVSNDSWWLTSTVNTSTKKISLYATGNSGDTRTAIVTVSYSGAGLSTCTKQFEVTQSGVNCDCSTLTTTPSSDITWQSSDDNFVTITINSGYCHSNFNVDFNEFDASDYFELQQETNTIIVGPWVVNTGATIVKHLIIEYRDGQGLCHKEITLTHLGATCDCSTMTVTPTSANLPYSANSASSDEVTFTIHSGYCHSNITIYASTWLSAWTVGNIVHVKAKTANESTSNRNGNVYVSYNAGAVSCDEDPIGLVITQNGRPCNCESDIDLTDIMPSRIPRTSSSGTAIIFELDNCISAITATSNSSWLSTLVEYDEHDINQGSITYSASENFGDERTAVITVSWSGSNNCSSSELYFITQEKACNCSKDFSLLANSVQFGYNDLSTKSVSYSSDTCITAVTTSVPTSAQTWLSATTSSNKQVRIVCNNENTGAPRSTDVIVSWSGSNNCSSSAAISVTQNGVPCDCDTLTTTPSSDITWQSNDDNFVTITINSGYCHSNINVDFNELDASDYFELQQETSNTINVGPWVVNTGATIVKHLVIEYRDGQGLCHKEITLTHLGATCDCSTLSVDPHNATLAHYANSTAGPIKIYSGYCHNNISVSANDNWLSASTDGDRIYIKALTANESTSKRNGNVYIFYSAGDIDCFGDEFIYENISVTQNGRPCDCSADFELINDSVVFAVNPSTTQVVGYSADACIKSISATSNVDWLNVSTESNRFVLSAATNERGERSTSVLVSWNGSNNCSSSTTISVTQNGVPCGCGNFGIDTTALTFAYTDSGTPKEITITSSGYCNSIGLIYISGDRPDAFSASTIQGNKIYVSTRNENEEITPKTATLIINYSAGSTSCSAKIVNLTQNGRPCNCDDLNIS